MGAGVAVDVLAGVSVDVGAGVGVIVGPVVGVAVLTAVGGMVGCTRVGGTDRGVEVAVGVLVLLGGSGGTEAIGEVVTTAPGVTPGATGDGGRAIAEKIGEITAAVIRTVARVAEWIKSLLI